MQEAARHIAQRLIAEAADAPARVERGYQLALARPPSEAERAAVLAFLSKQAQQIRADLAAAGHGADEAERAALEAFCLVLLNANEFAYLY
jgi:hypothetical protein